MRRSLRGRRRQVWRADSGNPKPGEDPVYKVLHESRSSTAIIRRFSEFFGRDLMPHRRRKNVNSTNSSATWFPIAPRSRRRIPPGENLPDQRLSRRGDRVHEARVPQGELRLLRHGGGQLHAGTGTAAGLAMACWGSSKPGSAPQAKYGYQDKPVWTTEALYHSTAPNSLSLHAQSGIEVREAMLALANGVQRMCAAGLLRDCTDDYRLSNWAWRGFCFREPEMNPKPSYAMYAWLTQIPRSGQVRPVKSIMTAPRCTSSISRRRRVTTCIRSGACAAAKR